MQQHVTVKKTILILCAVVLTALAAVVAVRFAKEKRPGEDVGEPAEELYYKVTPEEHITAQDTGLTFADNELLVVVQDGVDKQAVERLAEKYDAKIVGCIEVTGDYQLELQTAHSMESLEKIAKEMEQEEIVLRADLNYVSVFDEDYIDFDIQYGKKWSADLRNEKAAVGRAWSVKVANVDDAWAHMDQIRSRLSPIDIGLIDVCFDETSALDYQFAQTFYNDDSNGLVSENYKKDQDYGHGTHVTGIFAASGRGDEGICGVYPYSEGHLYASAITGALGEVGNGNNQNTCMHLKVCLAELILRNVKVINVSLNNSRDRVQYIEKQQPGWQAVLWELTVNADILGDFLNRNLKKGYDFVIASAAGNSSIYFNGNYEAKYNSFLNAIEQDDYPDVFSRIIVVGSLSKKLQISDFSNAGERVDIFAPGEQVYSTLPGGTFGVLSGTSMASPLVAGVAALVWTVDPELSGSDVKSIVCDAVNEDGNAYRMIDAEKAVLLAEKQNAASDPKQAQEAGSIHGFLVDKNRLNVVNNAVFSGGIANAKITVTNAIVNAVVSGQFSTDRNGHFEIILPPGQYNLTISASGYPSWTSPKPIPVRNGQVYSIKDWITLTALKNPEPASTGSASAGRTKDGQVYWAIFDKGSSVDKIELSTFTVSGNATRVYAVWDDSLTPVSDGGTVSACKRYHYDDGWVYDRNDRIVSDSAAKIYAGNFDVYDRDGKLVMSAAEDFEDAQSKAVQAKKDRLVQQKIAQIVGTYTGQYTASQGVTGLTLSVYPTGDVLRDTTILQRLADTATDCSKNSAQVPQQKYSAEDIKGIVQKHSGDYIAFFHFYPTAENPDVEYGLYTMTVDYDVSTALYSMAGETWVQRDSYAFVGLCDIHTENNQLIGKVDQSEGAYSFTVRKQ